VTSSKERRAHGLKNEVGNAQARPGSIAELRQQNGRNQDFPFCDIATDEIRKAAGELFLQCATRPLHRHLRRLKPFLSSAASGVGVEMFVTLFQGIDTFHFSSILGAKGSKCM
jgi:hypothetical protein